MDNLLTDPSKMAQRVRQLQHWTLQNVLS